MLYIKSNAINFFGITIPLYAIMTFCGVLAFFITFIVILKREKFGRQTFNRLLFLSVPGIIVLYISALILNSIFHSIENGSIIIGGITWLGGIIGVVPFMIFMIHKFVPKARGNAVNYFALFIPGLVLGHMFGRIGCLFAGCCYGQVTDSAIGIIYAEGFSAANLYPANDGTGDSLPVLPTQLFEAAFELVLLIVLICTRKKLKNYNVEIYLIAYGIFRFVLEFFRGDDRGSTGFFLSPSQFICIILLVLAVLSILFRNGITFKKLKAKCKAWADEAEMYDDNITEKEEAPSKTDSSIEQIKKLHKLMEDGIITQEEFEKKKTELLNRM